MTFSAFYLLFSIVGSHKEDLLLVVGQSLEGRGGCSLHKSLNGFRFSAVEVAVRGQQNVCAARADDRK